MMTISNEAPEDIEALLPWHAAGTLSRRDAERVERAIAADRELARRFELVREELAETVHLNETLGAPSSRAMERLFAAIDAEPARTPRVSLNLAARVTEFFAGLSPRTLAWSATAAALAIVLQAGLLAGLFVKERGPSYETASAPEQAQVVEGSYALVRFAPQATAEEITAFLKAHKATVVDGPNFGTGMYRVRVADKALPQEELARLIKQMQDDHRVIGFAAPTP
ncbi:MAG TPA: hypothetical protein VG985_01020 [Xanthobacteraceae bacterium]|nr:hypothetical protein [Xanthobacteraceae bacterium]